MRAVHAPVASGILRCRAARLRAGPRTQRPARDLGTMRPVTRRSDPRRSAGGPPGKRRLVESDSKGEKGASSSVPARGACTHRWRSWVPVEYSSGVEEGASEVERGRVRAVGTWAQRLPPWLS